MSELDISSYLNKKYDFDVYAINFLSSDIIQHFFWEDFRDKGARSKSIPAIYSMIDQAIGRLIDICKPENVVIFSDHGFGIGPRKYFNINSWLKANELLEIRLTGEDTTNTYINAKSLDFSKTRAYRFPLKPPSEGIEINLKGRQRKGIVKKSEYESLCRKIATLIRETKDGYELAAKETFLKDELYGEGPYKDHFPDIVFTLNPAYKGTSKITNTIFEDIKDPYGDGYTGTHRREGMYILPKGATDKDILNMVDLPYVLLGILGIRRDDFDRLPLEGAAKMPSHKEDGTVHEKLRQLGYV
jgi:predicted AlkP superfamily phosphohydrolase/phosphomutase